MTIFNYALAALGAVATSNHSGGSTPPAHMIDGSDATIWAPGAQYSDTVVKIDLGAAQYITDVRVKASCGTQYLNNWVLYYSFDGVTYYDTNVRFDYIGDATKSVGPITARYWMLDQTQLRGDTSIATWELRGPIEAPPPPSNPAPAYIAAWLDGLEANYVPAVQDWLDAN